jgi:hypothetical protein
LATFIKICFKKSKFGPNRTIISGTLHEHPSNVYIVDSNTKYFVVWQKIELLRVHGNAFNVGYTIHSDIRRITMHNNLIVAFRGNTFIVTSLLTVTNVARQYTQKTLSRIHDNSG